MPTFYFVYIPGVKSTAPYRLRKEIPESHTPKPGNDLGIIIEDLDDLPLELRSSVLFMVRDPDRERALAVITAIKEVHNVWLMGDSQEYESSYTTGSLGNYIRPHNNWRQDLFEGHAEEGATRYVYVYAAPTNYAQWLSAYHDPMVPNYHPPKANEVKPFYVGKGVGNRWLFHIREMMPYISLQNIALGVNREYGKTQKIYEHLIRVAESACQDLVRKVAIFSGQYAEEKSFAVENFLINTYGIYQLKNLNRGDTNSGVTEFIARPKYCIGGDDWLSIVNEFAEIGAKAYTQVRSNRLIAQQMNQEFSMNISGEYAIHPNLKPLSNSSSAAIEADRDVFYRMQIVDPSNSPIVQVHLKIRIVNSTCRINLRPIQGKEKEFLQLIANTFFGGNQDKARDGVMDIARAPYFKPCAGNFIGDEDIWFDFTEIDAPIYQIYDCPWLGHGELWLHASFRDVLRTITQKFLNT